MPSLKLSNPLRRDPSRFSLATRAAALRASLARVINREPDRAADPFDERPCPPGFVPYPVDAPMSWLTIPAMLHAEGERLLLIAEAEFNRRLLDDDDHALPEPERRQRATRHHRELRIDALRVLAGRMDPSRTPLPEPGSEAAKAAFRLACTRTDQLDRQAIEGYPELQRTWPAPTWWATDDLSRALERGEITPTVYARLYPLAAEREHRIRAATIATNVAALYALAHADQPPARGAFAGCSMADLARLHDTVRRIWMHATAERDAPVWAWAGDGVHSAAGEVIAAASDDLEALMNRVLDEARRRRPADDEERDERLALLLSDPLRDGFPPEPALLAQASAAWGVPA